MNAVAPGATTVCYAPLCELGLGTGNAAVINQKGGRRVRFKLTRTATLIGGRVLCVECESLMVVDGLHRAKLPDGQMIWVKDARETLAQRPDFADDDTAA